MPVEPDQASAPYLRESGPLAAIETRRPGEVRRRSHVALPGLVILTFQRDFRGGDERGFSACYTPPGIDAFITKIEFEGDSQGLVVPRGQPSGSSRPPTTRWHGWHAIADSPRFHARVT